MSLSSLATRAHGRLFAQALFFESSPFEFSEDDEEETKKGKKAKKQRRKTKASRARKARRQRKAKVTLLTMRMKTPLLPCGRLIAA